ITENPELKKAMKIKSGGYAKNKKVIRKDNVKGDFTTVNYSILRDKRLSPNSKLLLIEILSDKDDFKFSEQLYMNRMGISKTVLYKAISNLKEVGYLKSTKIGNTHYNFYTISEYGKLNKKTDKCNAQEPNLTEASKAIKDTTYMDSNQFHEDWKTLEKYLQQRSSYLNIDLLNEMVPKVKTRDDVFNLRQTMDKEIKKNKAAYYKRVEEYVNGGSGAQELKEKILKEVRRLITNEHKMPEEDDIGKIRYRINLNKRRNKVKRYGYDQETQDVERYENPLD
ncbi:MAG: hypothetical protein AAGH46_06905, partial [Bacteroidota bacterium]